MPFPHFSFFSFLVSDVLRAFLADTKDRTDKGMRPVTFRVVEAAVVQNPVLTANFEACKERMAKAGREPAEMRTRRGFHGAFAFVYVVFLLSSFRFCAAVSPYSLYIAVVLQARPTRTSN